MTDYKLTKLDAEPDQRTWSTGHYCVRKDNRATVLFLFDYPESICKMNSTQDEALADAKLFIHAMELKDDAK
jgi:hypothetical protein